MLTRRDFLKYTVISGATILGASFLGCMKKEVVSEKSGGATEIIDSMGRKVYVKVPVDRVVITFNVEEFIAVGGKDALKKIVGWSKYYWKGRRPTVWEVYSKRFPWIDEIPDVGYPWKGTFSGEKVIDLEPDVVIMSKEQYKYIKDDVKKLDKVGIPVVFIDYYEPFNIATHMRSTFILGKLLGKEDKARELMIFYTRQVESILKEIMNVEEKYPKPKVLLLGKGWISYGRNHYRGKMIELAGGINVASKVLEQSGEISPEYVLRVNPDVVIFIGKKGWNVDLGYGISEDVAKRMLKEIVESRAGWKNLNAVKNNRVYAIHIYFVHGHIFDYVALQFFIKWFYPEAEEFKQLDPIKAWKDFHERFLPVKYSGTWAVSL